MLPNTQLVLLAQISVNPCGASERSLSSVPLQTSGVRPLPNIWIVQRCFSFTRMQNISTSAIGCGKYIIITRMHRCYFTYSKNICISVLTNTDAEYLVYYGIVIFFNYNFPTDILLFQQHSSACLGDCNRLTAVPTQIEQNDHAHAYTTGADAVVSARISAHI